MPAHTTVYARTLIVLAALATVVALVALPISSTAAPARAQKLEHRLSNHVSKVAAVKHNTSQPTSLEDAARYIEAALAGEGYKVRRQEYEHDGHRVRNLEVSLINTRNNKPPRRIFIVGAHYDSACGAPSANNNDNDNDNGSGSGTAAVLELARMLKGIRLSQGTELKFVFFVNQQRPYISAEGMGSWQHARDLRTREQPVAAALNLETIGDHTSTRNSQRYLPGLEKLYPTQGNFIAFVGTVKSSEMVRKTLAAFKATSNFPAQGLVSASYVEGVTWSDHTSYNRHGYPAIMITDTAFLRYPYYHSTHDTPGKPDYRNMALMVEGLARVIEGIATPTRM